MYSKDEETIFQSKICTISPFLLAEDMSNEKIPMVFWRILMQVSNIYCSLFHFFWKIVKLYNFAIIFQVKLNLFCFCPVYFILRHPRPKAQNTDYYETPFTRWLIPEIFKPILLSFGYSEKQANFCFILFWATLVLAQQDMDYNKTPFTRWLISEIFKDSCLGMIWGLNNSDLKETQKRKFKTFYFIYEAWKFVKLTDHTYARNSLTNFEDEGRAITGNGNAKSWFWKKMKSQQTSLNNSDHKETH